MQDRPLPLLEDGRPLGLERRVVPTSAGPVVVHAGAPSGGPALLLVHGAAGSWTTWTPMLQLAAAAGAPLLDVVAVDLPGWGDSVSPVRTLDAALAAQVLAETARAAGHDRWTVVGHSLGGFAALELAVQEPEATEGVVLVSPTGPAVVDAIRRPVRGGARLPWFAGMLLGMRVLDALPGDGRALLRAVAPVLGPLSAPLFARRRSLDPSVGAAFARELRPAAFMSATRAAAHYDLGRWRAVRCPVRSIRGVRDVFVGGHDGAAIGALVPDLVETVLPDAGHFAEIERPDAVLRAIGEARRG